MSTPIPETSIRWLARFTPFFLLLPAALGIVAGSWFFYRYDSGRTSIEKYGDLAGIAALKAGEIGHWRSERLTDVRGSAEDGWLREHLAAWLTDPAGRPGELERLRGHLEHDRDVKGGYSARLLDADGRVILMVGGKGEPLIPDELQLLRSILARRTPVLGDLHANASGSISFNAMAPVVGNDSQLLAVLDLDTDAGDRLFPLVMSWPIVSTSAETLLVRREGDEVVFLNELRHKPGTALALRYPLSRTELPEVRAVLGERGMFAGADYRGVPVLADLRPVPGTPWFIVTKTDRREILAEVRDRTAAIGLLTGFLVLFAAATVAFLYRRRQAGLYKTLYQTERREREVLEEFRTTLYSIGDAVITTDARGIVKRMNGEAERLTGWTEGEAAGKSLGEVFNIVNEKTRGPAQNPVERVLREGIVVGLANHTVLLARDGKEYPIADSGAPIRDGIGSIIGTVLVFRDQSSERFLEKALEEQRRALRGRVKELNCLYHISRTIETVLCTADAVLARICTLLPPAMLHPNLAWAAIRIDGQDQHATREGASGPRLSREIKFGGAAVGVLEIGYTAPGPAGGTDPFLPEENSLADAVAEQLGRFVERYRTQEALRESEERYRALFDQVGDAIMVLELNPTEPPIIRDMNAAGLRLHGYGREEVIGRPVTLLESDLSPEALTERDRLVSDWGGHTLEITHQCKDGSEILLEAILHRMASDGRDLVVSVERDITGRKHEDALQAARLRIIEFAASNSLAALLHFALDELCAMTRSSAGFFHLVEPDRTLWHQAVSTRTERMGTTEKKGSHHYIDQAGVWADCVRERRVVIHNDCAALPHRKGLPPGHAPVQREMAFPIIRDEIIRAIIGVGNKPQDYSEADAAHAEKLVEFIWESVHRKQLEEALRDSEYFFKESQCAARIGSYKLDVTAGAWRSSAVLGEIFGIDEAYDKSLRGWLEIVHPEDQEELDRYLREDVLAKHQPFDREYRIVRRSDGALRWVHGLGKIALDAEGRVVSLIGTIQDTTERRQMEEVSDFLARSRHQNPNKGFFDSLSQYLSENLKMEYICIVRLNRDDLTALAVVYHDGVFEEIASYALKDTPCGEVIEKQIGCFPAKVCQLFPRDEALRDLRAESYAGVTLSSSTGKPIGLIAAIGRKPLADATSVVAILKIVAVHAAAELERQMTEERLRKALAEKEVLLAFNEAVVQNANTGLMVLDRDLRVTRWNQYLVALTGLKSEEVMGRWIGEIAPQLRDEELLSLLRRGLQGESGQFPDLLMEFQQIGSVWVASTFGPIPEATGQAKEVVVSSRDVTKERRMQARMQEQERLASIGELAGAIAHEIKNPLFAITGGLQVLDLELQMDAGQQAYMKTILEEGMRIDRLIRQLRIYSRPIELERRPVDIGVLLESVVLSMRGPVQKRGLRILLEPLQEKLTLSVDSDKLKQVLGNLIQNSLEASREGGTIHLSLIAAAESIAIVVSDDGTGIVAGAMDRIFDPLFTTKADNTGLGLHISRAIVSEHGGELNVTSIPGVGTRAMVVLPSGEPSD